MLKRIKVIKQVGVFKDYASGGDKEFGKLTFIHGLNTYGKSTLCDIFKSLLTGNNEYITKRKSRPASGNQQEIVVMADEIGSPTEKNIIFKNDNWTGNFIGKDLKVFDTAFVYDNLFDGINLLEDRSTKENFSDFILGSEGVQLSKELETKNGDLRAKKKELKDYIPDYLKKDNPKSVDEKAIKDFIELKVDESLEDLKKLIEDFTDNKRELLKGVQNKDKILALPEPKKLTPNDLSKLTSTIDNANTLLETSFDKLSESAVKMLQDHIKKHLNNNSEAENWIKEGLPYVNTNTCPFCGQSLDSVKDLIQSYQSFFNKEYTDFITSIDSNLDTHVYAVAIILDSEKDINEVLLSLKDYAEKIEAPEFKSAASAIGEFKAKILLVEEDITKAVAAMKAVLDECSKKKKKKPYCKIEAISKSSLINLIGQYEENLTNINEKIGIVQRHISSYKQKYRDNTAAAEVDTLIHKINACEKKKARLEQNSKCVEYSKLSKAIDDLAGEIVKLSDDINKNQSAFLDKYFAAIDSIFSELGSDKFKIEKGKPSDKGDKKVYGISVKFKDEQIPLKDLPFTFSDSDRRALALSIFWAKIKIMEADEMSKQIIVLDDPVTSFDDNRILKNNELILSFKDKVNQVILLTHYDSFVKQFYSRCNRGEGCVFLKLEQNHLTSMFEKMDIENFCCGEMEKNFSCISDFICQKSKEDVRNKLRIYFDNHLTLLFYKYLSENNLLKQDLETKINKLKEGNHITEPVREQLQTYRQMLNTDSHIFTDNNEADIRSFADGVMKLIHNIEIRALN